MDANFTVSHDELRRRCSDFLSMGTVFAVLSFVDKRRIDDGIEDGKNRFYKPGDPFAGYEWTFLKPTTTITAWATVTGTVSGTPTYSPENGGESTITVSTGSPFYDSGVNKNFTFDTSSNTYEIKRVTSATVAVVKGDASGETSGDTYTMTSNGDYLLPEDFAAINGDFAFGADDPYGRIGVVPESEIRRYRQYSTTTNKPRYAAIRALATDDKQQQRYQLMVYPTPDAAYELSYQYIRIPPRGGGEAKYPVGSAVHRDTLIEACLAALEEQLNDMTGLHNARFTERLAASVAIDRKLKPQRSVNLNRFSQHAMGGFNRRARDVSQPGMVSIGGVLPT